MVKIIYEKEKCIGCGSCAALCPKYWVLSEDGKARLLNSKNNQKTGNEELKIKEIGCIEGAAQSCPVQIIHIVK
jgi:ferredoxin